MVVAILNVGLQTHHVPMLQLPVNLELLLEGAGAVLARLLVEHLHRIQLLVSCRLGPEDMGGRPSAQLAQDNEVLDKAVVTARDIG